ncbi:MAG: hypothetical protein HW387_669 [Parachlamydiales bacterium]|nr:hypothetical protein [Parachlamydiales bacterium]
MNWNNSLNRIMVGAVASLVATSAYAIPKGSCEKPVDVCCDEPRPGPFAFSYPKDVNLACPVDFYVNAAFLIFQAKQDGMEFGLRDSDGVNLPITHGEILGFSHNNSDWDYNPGVRVGLGFYLHHDAWTIDFDWTWLNITDYAEYSSSNGGMIIPIWLPPIQPVATWRSLSAVWDAHYNTIDARLGKPYHISRYVVVKPHFGFRAAFIDQHFSVHHGGVFNGQTDAIHHGDNNFWGVGARAGIESEWIVGKGWQLFGNCAGSMLFGKFDIDQNVALGAGGYNTGFDLDWHKYDNVPNVDIQLGIAWNKYFNKNKYRIGVAAAYEFHEWFDQFNMKRFFGTTTASNPTTTYQWQTDTASRGNLTLNGFSFKLQLDI